MEFEINEIKVDPASYRHYWFGIPGIGKSSTYRDFILRLYNNPRNGLLIVTGDESGHKALKNLQYKLAPDWDTFIEIVDYLVENKDSNDIRIVGMDTVDELIEIASKQVLYLHRIQKKENATSIKACFGGYGAGKRMVIDLVEAQIGRLDRAGYGMVFIGHSKFKDLTDKETDNQYQMLTSNLENDYHAIFANKCDIMCVMQVKRNIKDGKLMGEKRVMRFRASLDVDAKSRIAGLPDEVELSADNYVDAVETALKNLAGLDDTSFEDKKKEEVKVKNQESEKQIKKEIEKKYGSFKTVEEYVSATMEIAKNLGKEQADTMKAELTKNNLPTKISSITDIEIAKKVYALFNAE